MSLTLHVVVYVFVASIALGEDWHVSNAGNTSDDNDTDMNVSEDADLLSDPTSTSSTLSTLSSTTSSTTSSAVSSTSSLSSTTHTHSFTTSTSTSKTLTTLTQTTSTSSSLTSSVSSTTTTESNSTTSSTTTSTYSNTTQTTSSSTATTQTTSWTSSTTSFTVTNTSTTTSTTTTRVYFLAVDVAHLTATHLTLTFNYPARWVPDVNSSWSCHELFDDMTASKLGVSPSCSLSDDISNLEVVLGDRASLQVGEVVSLEFGVFIPAGGVVYLPTDLTALATTTEPTVPVEAVLVAPDISPVCARLRFSTALSSGFAGRAPVITWQLGNSTHVELGRLLQPVLTQASNHLEQILEIPPETLFAAVAAVQELQENDTEMVLEVVSSVTNWHGETDEASAMLTVLNVEEPLPQIVPVSRPRVEISQSQEAQMAVEVLPTQEASFCRESISRSRFEDVEDVEGSNDSTAEVLVVPVAPLNPGAIHVHWEYRRLDEGACVFMPENANESFMNETGNWSNASDMNMSSNVSCPMMQWQRLENLTFADLDRKPTGLRFAGFAFQPNSTHQFKATAVREGYENASNRSAVIYTLDVLPRARPMVSLLGPMETSSSCAATLSAHVSDASVVSSDWRAEAGEFQYAWQCVVGVLADMNESEIREADSCGLPNMSENVWTNASELAIGEGTLSEEAYTFTVRVRRRDAPAEEANASWSVRVRPGPWPRVALHVPWRPGQALSTASRDVRATAEVIGSSSCPVPGTWSWQWALLNSNSSIVVPLRTMNESSLDEPSGTAVLSTAEFRSDLLAPGHLFAYVLVGNDITIAAEWELVNATLAQLSSTGAFVAWSPFFRADAPPWKGVVECAPRSGFSVTTPFSVRTFGWLDEQEDALSYSFFRFPAHRLDGLRMEEGSELSLPDIDWRNASSPRYFQKQGGLALRAWDRAKSVSDILMAAGSYFLVVRARDQLGAEGTAAVLGPMVLEPAELSATAATNALKVAFASSDVDRILNAVDATLSAPISSPVSSTLLEAMEVAASVLDPTPEGLEKLSYAVAAVVRGGGGTGMGLLLNKSQLTQAADVLENCIGLALDSAAEGIGVNLGVAMLEGISAVNFGARMGQEEGELNESINFTHQVEMLTSKLADAGLAQLQLGESVLMSAVNEGVGTALELSRSSSSAVGRGFRYGRISVPPRLDLLARRLQAPGQAGQSCDVLDVKMTLWQRSNPYSWADPAKGLNRHMAQNTTVAVLQLDFCGSPVTFNETDPDMAVEVRDVDLPPKPPTPAGHWLDVLCARWSVADQSWVFNGVDIKRPVYYDAVKVTCLAFYGGSAYAAVWFPVEVTTTSSTLEWTYPTYTTFQVPTLPPVYVVSCNTSLLPDPPVGSWDCTKPGEGQECRASCFGFPDLIYSITCLKGTESLEWFVTNYCPVYTTTTTFEEVEIPADSAVVGGLLIFVWIVLVSCGAGVAGLLCYGIYRFAMNEQEQRKPSRTVFPEDEAEEDAVDPRFMEWAQQWAERPTVDESALVGVKHQVSLPSQGSMAIADQSASSPEHAELDDSNAAPGRSAFTVTVQIEYSDNWREELDELLETHEIGRQTEGRLYYVVNTVREILETRDLETLHKVNFPLSVHLQDANPTVEKSEAFYGWQVEWGALRPGQDPDIHEPVERGSPELKPAMQQTFDDVKLPLQHRQHQDLMKKWREHQQQQKLRTAADPKASGKETSDAQLRSSDPMQKDPVQEVLDRYKAAGHVQNTTRFGGALADTAAQASVLVPELQASYYEDLEAADQGWLEVQSPSGRIYYWNQITQEVWDPPPEEEFSPEPDGGVR